MTIEQLTRLVVNGESDRLEFKKSTGDLKGGLETLCALLNGERGRVVFGVTKTGKIVGQDIADATLQDVARELRRLEPPTKISQAHPHQRWENQAAGRYRLKQFDMKEVRRSVADATARQDGWNRQ